MVITSLAGFHVLLALSLYIIGNRSTQFPEYSVVIMLDDIKLFYYSNTSKLIYRNYKSDHKGQEQEDATYLFGHDYNSLRNRALSARKHINVTHGTHVVQRLSSCELLDDGRDGPVRVQDAFDGVTEEEVSFTTKDNSLSVKSEGLWKTLWDEKKRVRLERMYTQYSQICFKTLKNVLRTKRNETSKVEPSVEFFQRTLPEGKGAKLTCLATGFYPRHINLTLLRDGQPVSDHQITGGELLPNGDETYQIRKSLEVRPEELREKHKYTCTVDHISEKRTIHLVLDRTSMMTVVLICVVVFICGAGAITAYVFHRKKQRGMHFQYGEDSPEGTEDLSSSTKMEMSTQRQPGERAPLKK